MKRKKRNGAAFWSCLVCVHNFQIATFSSAKSWATQTWICSFCRWKERKKNSPLAAHNQNSKMTKQITILMLERPWSEWQESELSRKRLHDVSQTRLLTVLLQFERSLFKSSPSESEQFTVPTRTLLEELLMFQSGAPKKGRGARGGGFREPLWPQNAGKGCPHPEEAGVQRLNRAR